MSLSSISVFAVAALSQPQVALSPASKPDYINAFEGLVTCAFRHADRWLGQPEAAGDLARSAVHACHLEQQRYRSALEAYSERNNAVSAVDALVSRGIAAAESTVTTYVLDTRSKNSKR